MSDAFLKPEKDFTKDADKLIPEAEALGKVRPQISDDRKIRANFVVRLMFRVRSISYLCSRSKRGRSVTSFGIFKPSPSSLTTNIVRLPTLLLRRGF